MRLPLAIGAVVLAVFVIVGIAALPASLVLDRLPAGLSASGASGTVWSGGADQLRFNGTPLGALEWTAEPASLLRLRLALGFELTRTDGFLRGHASVGVDGTVVGDALALRLPIDALNPHGANGWRGMVAGTIAHVRLEQGWPTELTGRLTLTDVLAPGSALRLGSYVLEFDPPPPGAHGLSGRVHDQDGPLVVRGQLDLDPRHSYRLAGDVAPRPGAPAEVTEPLRFLGQPDAAGRRSFEITGTF